jgi:arylsulfatase A-like enzyme
LAGKFHLSACHPAACPGTERRINDGYDEFYWAHGPFPQHPTNDYMHWLREKGVPLQRDYYRGSRYVEVSVPEEHHWTTWCAQKAINFIEDSAAFDEPWLFSVNLFDPHHPFDPPQEYLERYLDRLDDIPLPNYTPGELDNKPIFQQQGQAGSRGKTGFYPFLEMADGDHRLIRAAYWAMVDLVDAQVGRILGALKRTGQWENTIVVFMSDHGEMLGDHGIYLKGPYFYEPMVRVPLIISWPGAIQAGRHSRALVELVDIAPTLLDAVGLQRHPGMQGRSLWPMLAGRAGLNTHRDDVYCEDYNASRYRKEPPAYCTMVRTDSHKLVVIHGLGSGELYDLERDPDETHNRWDDAEYQSVKLAMLQRVCDRMAWTVDPLPLRDAMW